jgi:SpoVK/Ycf46/Vps4 family AAA+-type ATPase
VLFHIDFRLPLFDQAENTVVTEDDKKIFSDATRLPREDWTPYWQRIYLDETIKDRALHYCLLAQTLREHEISRMTLTQHHLLVFYGPPGTGKTTLVRGLANEVARALQKQSRRSTFFVEIKAHALSTVDLGGGPKLVAQAFGRVEELASAGNTVICFLDEVESLLTNRTMTLNDANPVDVFRSVNAVFQQIDRLAERANVFTFATSNLPKAIDRAFFDRADLLFLIDLPDKTLRARILCDVFTELNHRLQMQLPEVSANADPQTRADWNDLLEATDGFSGRHLRKLVLQAMIRTERLSMQPELLCLEDITCIARDTRARMKHDREHGGTYEYTYDNTLVKGEEAYG